MWLPECGDNRWIDQESAEGLESLLALPVQPRTYRSIKLSRPSVLGRGIAVGKKLIFGWWCGSSRLRGKVTPFATQDYRVVSCLA
jgi:hypothetical protein